MDSVPDFHLQGTRPSRRRRRSAPGTIRFPLGDSRPMVEAPDGGAYALDLPLEAYPPEHRALVEAARRRYETAMSYLSDPVTLRDATVEYDEATGWWEIRRAAAATDAADLPP